MNKIILPLLLFFIFSCGEKKLEELVFVHSQPFKIKNIPSFPKKYQGKYGSLNDSSHWLITKNQIISHDINYILVSKIEYDTLKEVLKKLNITKEGNIHDSILLKQTFIDTIFNLKRGDLLKKYNGYLFVNTKSFESWTVKRLKLRKNKFLTIEVLVPQTVDSTYVVEEISDTTQIENNTSSFYLLNPNKKDLMNLFKNHNQYYSRILLKNK